jgi:hypothetical protein
MKPELDQDLPKIYFVSMVWCEDKILLPTLSPVPTTVPTMPTLQSTSDHEFILTKRLPSHHLNTPSSILKYPIIYTRFTKLTNNSV